VQRDPEHEQPLSTSRACANKSYYCFVPSDIFSYLACNQVLHNHPCKHTWIYCSLEHSLHFLHKKGHCSWLLKKNMDVTLHNSNFFYFGKRMRINGKTLMLSSLCRHINCGTKTMPETDKNVFLPTYLLVPQQNTEIVCWHCLDLCAFIAWLGWLLGMY
jgi:hypothetical protein